MNKNGERNTNMAFIFSLELVESNPEAYASFILNLKESQYNCAITSQKAKDVQEIKNVCSNINIYTDNESLVEIVSVMVSIKEFKRCPPEPHIFLEAADQMETPYLYCYVLTNSEIEVSSALSAGMRVLYVSENKLPNLSLDELFSVRQYKDFSDLQNSLEIHGILGLVSH